MLHLMDYDVGKKKLIQASEAIMKMNYKRMSAQKTEAREWI